jgi:hypothetical protein
MTMFAKIKTYFHDLFAKIKADILNAFALIGTMLGSALSHLDALAATLGDPNLTQQFSTVFADAKWFGRWMLTVGIVTAIANFKKLVQSPPKV